MKVIDNKGRLFGIINVIDLAVILIFAAILIFGVSRMSKNTVTSRETKTAVVTYEISDVREITVNSINVGDPIYHYDKGTYIGTIVSKDVQNYKDVTENNGEWVNADVPGKYSVTIEVEAQIEETDQFYLVGGEQTRVGNQFRLKNKNFTSFGTCFGVSIK